ncbi:spermatogenesis-defective protein 39 homolog isoform X3 [Ornithodoros turicata]
MPKGPAQQQLSSSKRGPSPSEKADLQYASGTAFSASSTLRAFDVGDIQKHITAIKSTSSSSSAITARITTPKETVQNIILGQPYFIEQHRSKEDKVELLDEALQLQDGNVIVLVLLFLKRTLKPALFNQELLLKPRAASHYLSYLRMVKDNVEVMNTFAMLGMAEDAAMFKYRLISETSDAKSRTRGLESYLQSHLQSEPSLALQTELIKEQKKLLEIQDPIEESDAQTEKEGKDLLMREFPRPASVVGTSLVTTLYYCCMYHYHKPVGHVANPSGIKDLFGLTEKQYMWTALTALAQIRHWKEIDNLFQSKSWLGKSKMRCCIGFDRAVQVLMTMKAPPEVFEKYLQLVDDTDKRLALAKKNKCYNVVIDTLVSLRDRQQLISYRDELMPQSVPFFKAQEALNVAFPEHQKNVLLRLIFHTAFTTRRNEGLLPFSTVGATAGGTTGVEGNGSLFYDLHSPRWRGLHLHFVLSCAHLLESSSSTLALLPYSHPTLLEKLTSPLGIKQNKPFKITKTNTSLKKRSACMGEGGACLGATKTKRSTSDVLRELTLFNGNPRIMRRYIFTVPREESYRKTMNNAMQDFCILLRE